MQMVEHKLTTDEKNRNKHGPMHIFKYTKENLGMGFSIIYFIYINLVYYLYFVQARFQFQNIFPLLKKTMLKK